MTTKTKHKFHEVLQWIADNETIEYKHPIVGKTFETIPTKQVLEFLAKDNFSHVPVDCFRIKPKEKSTLIQSITYIDNESSGEPTIKVTLSTSLDVFFSAELLMTACTPVKIVTEQWYNEQINKR